MKQQKSLMLECCYASHQWFLECEAPGFLESTYLGQSATVGSISILCIVGLLRVRYEVVLSDYARCIFKAFSDLSVFELSEDLQWLFNEV